MDERGGGVRGLGLLRGLLDHALLGVLHSGGTFGVFGTTVAGVVLYPVA